MFTLATQTAAGGGLGMMLIVYGLIFGAFWFFLIRPQKKKDNEAKAMRENIQIGDEIMTIGGFVMQL